MPCYGKPLKNYGNTGKGYKIIFLTFFYTIMPARSIATTFCNKIERFMQQGNPSNMRTQMGFLQALYTDQNLQGGRQEQSDYDANEGRAISIYRNFYQRGSGVGGVQNIAADGSPDLCTPGTQKQMFQTLFEFNLAQDTWYHKITLSDAQMRNYCNSETKDTELQRILESNLNDFYLTLNRAMLARYAAGVGSYVGGGAVKSGAAFVSGNIDVSVNSIADVVRREFEEMEYADQPFIVGWNNIKEYFRKGEFGCCNTNVGVDVQASTNYGLFFQDLSVPTTLAPNTQRFLAFQPGHVIPMEFTRNGGDFKYEPQAEVGDAINFDSLDSVNTTITDSTNTFDVPFQFDMYIRKSDCGIDSTWTITLAKTMSLLFAVPSDAFTATDRLVGTNGALLFDATSA
jgi:hypothetical protein